MPDIVSKLDSLIKELEGPASEPADLLLEHISSARTYWLGAMPLEFAIALQDARLAASQLHEHDRRQAIVDTIGHLQVEAEQVYPHQIHAEP